MISYYVILLIYETTSPLWRKSSYFKQLWSDVSWNFHYNITPCAYFTGQNCHTQQILEVYQIIAYSTGVQIVSCTSSDDSVLSESTGLFNPVLCVSQWNLFWQKNQPMRLCQVRPGREWLPSPLADFNRLFGGLIGELLQIWHWNMFFLNDISLAPKM